MIRRPPRSTRTDTLFPYTTLFRSNELGAWKDKLRPSFIVAPLPATLEEMMELPAYKRSWRVKALMLKLIVRMLLARLSGKRWVAGGAALQGRMLQAALRAGVQIRTDSPVSELIVEDGIVKGVLTTRRSEEHTSEHQSLMRT